MCLFIDSSSLKIENKLNGIDLLFDSSRLCPAVCHNNLDFSGQVLVTVSVVGVVSHSLLNFHFAWESVIFNSLPFAEPDQSALPLTSTLISQASQKSDNFVLDLF
ncbi:hypothetical protein Pan54_13380 [Rubinisphaera italica]|uniref:Uncharacterized protein n=1 Tax=Rubinisphaera italica TaxID=2527969 RepID=A0A5C5XCY3_9PLAN|nr:hypothetical protein Pan54_13380 [Rubinisphaera italica]